MKSVLIVDDEAQTRKLLGHLVKSLGYFPILASSAENALTIYQDNPDLSLILTDFQMHSMNGLELIEQIRSIQNTKRIPILVLSAYIKISEVNRIFEVGGDGFLPKPFSKNDIAEYLQRYLEY